MLADSHLATRYIPQRQRGQGKSTVIHQFEGMAYLEESGRAALDLSLLPQEICRMVDNVSIAKQELYGYRLHTFVITRLGYGNLWPSSASSI